MSASPPYEAAYRPGRLEFVRENEAGVAPSNPDFEFFSDNPRSIEPEIDAQGEDQRGLNDPDSQGVFAGTEASSLTIAYDLQQKTSNGNTLHDSNGDPNDAATDGLERDSINRIKNTHTVVRRSDQDGIDAAYTWNGSTSKDTRQYIVAKGGYIDSVRFTGDPNDPQPILVELNYEFEKVRKYQIDQPASDGTGKQIAVKSTDSGDTGVDVTVRGIDDTDSAAEETVSLDGTDATTLVDTDTQFQEIDAIEIASELVGTLEVYEDDDATLDTVTQGDQLTEIQGQSDYDHGEGDVGIPVLGTGSRATDINQPYELYHDDLVEQPSGTAIADGFETTEFTVENNVDGTNQGSTPRRALSAADREVEVSITVFGQTEHHDAVKESLTTKTDHVRWTMDGGHVQADTADPRDVSASEEVGDSKMMTDITYRGQGVTVSA